VLTPWKHVGNISSLDELTVGFSNQRRWWTACALRRSPLIRRIDRIEAGAVLVALLLAFFAVPHASTLGHKVFAGEAEKIAIESASRHPVDAIAMQPSAPQSGRPVATSVPVRWFADNQTHDKVIPIDRPVRAGEHVHIWLDNRGNVTPPVRSVDDAKRDALVTAVAAWIAFAALCATAVVAVRYVLDRCRYRRWERDIRILVDNDGGWAQRNT
jgi:hypothetical protein